MRKKALLAALMAMILLLSGCALVVKDEAVDNATITLLESGILFYTIGLIYRGLNGYTALERFDEIISAEIVKPHTDTLDALVVGQTGDILILIDLAAVVGLVMVIELETGRLSVEHEVALHTNGSGGIVRRVGKCAETRFNKSDSPV